MKKIGIYTGFSRHIPLETRLQSIKNAGFNAVCLNFEKELIGTETEWENQLKLTQKYELPVEAIHLTGSFANSLWSDDSSYAVNQIVNEISNLSKLGLKVGVLHVTWGLVPPPEPTVKALESFLRIAEIAEKQNVKIAFENSVSAKHLQFVLDNIKSDNIGFCYDSGHENAFTPETDLLSLYGDRLFAMHLHDNDGKNDMHLIPFEKGGTINWQEKAILLKKTNLFCNSIILELENQTEPIDVFLKNAYKSAVKLDSI